MDDSFNDLIKQLQDKQNTPEALSHEAKEAAKDARSKALRAKDLERKASKQLTNPIVTESIKEIAIKPSPKMGVDALPNKLSGNKPTEWAKKVHHDIVSGTAKPGNIDKLAGPNLLSRLGKGAGKAGIILSALGAGNKAMAGDFTGAAGDAGELAYNIAEPLPLTAAAPTLMGDAELPPEEMEKQQKYNSLIKKLQGK